VSSSPPILSSAGTSSSSTSLTILDVPIARLGRAEALDAIGRLLDDPRPSLVAFVNAHSLNLAVDNDRYRRTLQHAALVLCDGAGLALAARFQGSSFTANLNGTDLTPSVVLLAADRDLSVFLYGGQPGVAEQAAATLRRSAPDLRVAGCRDGYGEPDSAAAEISASGADLVLVALGNPRQELWLADHLESIGARVGIGVGAYFDFASNRIQRAPQWMRRLRLEWTYRLLREPRRMFRRYVIGNPVFLARAMRDARSRRH
jgi:exopolysaccharide biosynthesis WecB/TagA/CpsF family protein